MAATGTEISDLRKLTVVKLRDRLSKLGLPTSGLKADLVERLHQHYAEQEPADEYEEEEGEEESMDTGGQFSPPPQMSQGPPSGPPSLMTIPVQEPQQKAKAPPPPGPAHVTRTSLQMRLQQMAGQSSDENSSSQGQSPSQPSTQPPPLMAQQVPPPQISQPSTQPPPLMSQQVQPPKPQMNQPPSLMSKQVPPPNPPQMGQPPQLMQQQPPGMGPQQGQPPQMGQPPQQMMSPPPLGPPPQMSQPPPLGPPPQNMGKPPQMGPPPHAMGGQPPLAPPGTQMGQPVQPPPPGQMLPQVGQPPGQMGQPPQLVQSSQMGQQPPLQDIDLQEKIAMQTRLIEQERQQEQHRLREQQEQQRMREQQQKERLAIQKQAILLQQQHQPQPPAPGAEEGTDLMEKVRQQQIMLEQQKQKERMEQQQQALLEQQNQAIKKQEEERRRNEAELIRQQQIALMEAKREEQQKRIREERRGPPTTGENEQQRPAPIPANQPFNPRPSLLHGPGPRPLLPTSSPSGIPPLMPPRTSARSVSKRDRNYRSSRASSSEFYLSNPTKETSDKSSSVPSRLSVTFRKDGEHNVTMGRRMTFSRTEHHRLGKRPASSSSSTSKTQKKLKETHRRADSHTDHQRLGKSSAASTSSISLTGKEQKTVDTHLRKATSNPEHHRLGKRPAASSSSMSKSGKKRKTEDTSLRRATEEKRHTKKRPHRREHARCWVPGCLEPAKYMKLHAFRYHIPEIFSERLQPDEERVLRERRGALNQVTRWLLGRPASLDELMSFVKIQKLFVTANRTVLSPIQTEAMQAFCRFLKVSAPTEFLIDPINSPGALIHWKVLLLLAACLDAEERQCWKNCFHIPEGMVVELQEEQPVELLPEAYDSHFHLDRTLQELSLPFSRLEDIFARVHVDHAEKVKLVGSVAVFCDPHSYPSEQKLLDMPEDMKVAVGFHPKHAHQGHRERQKCLEQLFKLLQHPKVTALGEIGLDHREPMKFWAYQVELLEDILPKLEDRHVLVIYCQGMEGDCGTEAYLLLLYFLKKYIRSGHPIHLHCFTGDQYVLQKWLETFPRTYFGFTNLVDSYTYDQIAALREIEESRLLLESDAPYCPSRGNRVSSPSQLYRVAKTVAELRQSSAERILEVTVANALCLYEGQY